MNKIKILIAIIAVAVIVFVATRLMPQGEDQRLVPPTEPVASKETTPSSSAYRDGTYSARGTYYSPEGLERISFTVTLKDGIITDTSAVNESDDSTTKRYQDVFIKNYKALVVGKSIDEVKLDKVSGSSLTGGGFNQAISKIKAEASMQL
jgi:uncharacterized protein with FMN-binding domain